MKIPTEKAMFLSTVDEAESTISTTVVGPYHQNLKMLSMITGFDLTFTKCFVNFPNENNCKPDFIFFTLHHLKWP